MKFQENKVINEESANKLRKQKKTGLTKAHPEVLSPYYYLERNLAIKEGLV